MTIHINMELNIFQAFGNSTTQLAIVFFIFFLVLIVIFRPSSMFYPDGRMRRFGSGTSDSVWALGGLIPLISLLSYALSIYLLESSLWF